MIVSDTNLPCQVRYLTPGTALTAEEQDSLRQMLNPWHISL